MEDNSHNFFLKTVLLVNACLHLIVLELEKEKKKAAKTYKRCVFHQELRLVAACVEFHDVSVPAPEDDLFI